MCQSVFHVQDRMLPGNRVIHSLFRGRRGGGVLSLFFTQRLIPQIFVGFSVAGNTQASEESASCANQFAMFKTACCLGTA